MTGSTPAHGQGLAPLSHGHVFHVAVAITASLLNRTVLRKDETLNMALVVEANKIRQIMHLLPGNRLFRFPVFEQFLDAWSFANRLDVLVAANTFLQRRDGGYGTATRTGMTIHAIDFHPPLGRDRWICGICRISQTGMAVVWKFDGLLNQRPLTIGGLDRGRRISGNGYQTISQT